MAHDLLYSLLLPVPRQEPIFALLLLAVTDFRPAKRIRADHQETEDSGLLSTVYDSHPRNLKCARLL